MAIEELNRQLFEETVDEMEKRKENEREEKLMNENSKNEKDLELKSINPSQNDSVDNITIDTIVSQDTSNGNEGSDTNIFAKNVEEEYSFETVDIVTELTPWQKIYESLELTIEDGKIYKAKHKDYDFRNTSNGTMVFNWIFEICEKGLSKEENISFFFNGTDKCDRYSLKRIKELAQMFSLELKQKDFEDIHSLIHALECLKGTWVDLKPTTRIDEKTGKGYQNFEIVNVLGKNYEIGGNL